MAPRLSARERVARWLSPLLAGALLAGCGGHGPVGGGISAPLGAIRPDATDAQRETFARGQEVALRRFDLADGLGPAFNVTFCASCHERPVLGGSAGHYRSFFLNAITTADGAQLPAPSAGMAGGVQRLYDYAGPARPDVVPEADVFAIRNPIPFFGVGLIAALPEDAILAHQDPDDRNGDGISGRPNYDQGFVGRFGRKAQTVSIEGFIRGPLFNHLGVTTDPLTDAQKAALPVDSSGGDRLARRERVRWLGDHAQAAAPAGPLVDDDPAPDPELSTDDLFDLVSFAMLLAAPELTEPEGDARRGRDRFDRWGCGDCHVPRLDGPDGPLPLYSDLLLHDMGDALADGFRQGEATGSEFRTQPLWGLAAVGPYLHDGRADTPHDAILLHGGEALRARDRYAAASTEEQGWLLAFLQTLGGADQFTPGLLPPGAPLPEPGAYGGPLPGLSDDQLAAFRAGRAMFDRDFGLNEGLGGPRFNGDSCRACHFDPVIGGSGPRGVNVTRHGLIGGDGGYVEPAIGSILHRMTALPGGNLRQQDGAAIREQRQTPHLFGLGLVEGIDRAVIEAGADPDDADGDGISGRAAIVDGGRLGRFGWKAQVPSIAEFVRDAFTAELGLTLPRVSGLTFGRIHDNDGRADPEATLAQAAVVQDFLRLLGPPPRGPQTDATARGEALFAALGCDRCHVPALAGADGDVSLYSDLLLHDVLPAGTRGIEEGAAGETELRTPPLWGLGHTAPYLHDGRADTVLQAALAHDGEARVAREALQALGASDQDDLRAFLESL